jgi:hypothetical protein
MSLSTDKFLIILFISSDLTGICPASWFMVTGPASSILWKCGHAYAEWNAIKIRRAYVGVSVAIAVM